MSLSKKIFIGSSLLLIVVLLVWGAYTLSFKKPTTTVSTQPNSKTASTAPENVKKETVPETRKIIALTDEAVLAPKIDNDLRVIRYYAKSTGQIYQIDFDGQNKRTVTTQQVPGLTAAFWSPDGNRAILQIAQAGKTSFSVYDSATVSVTPLKDNVDSISWQNNDKILYKYYDTKTKERSLNIANLDGTNWLKIATLPYRNLSLASVPKTGLVSYWNSGDAAEETDFSQVFPAGQDNKLIFSGRYGADYLWSPDGKQILISSSDKQNGTAMQLGVLDASGQGYRSLSIPTLVSKCVWSGDSKTVYYALPSNIPENSILPNDYVAGKFNTQDTFWRIDVQTGEKARLIDLEELNKIKGSFDAADLLPNADESLLFFINRSDGKLYRINLQK